jgi:hypothetical protein
MNERFVIPSDTRAAYDLLDLFERTVVRDQDLMCEAALLYLAFALVHTDNLGRNVAAAKDLLDRFIDVLAVEHADCLKDIKKEVMAS